MKPLRILHTIETGGPGGAETVFLDLVSRLDPDRFASTVLVPEDKWLNQSLRSRGIATLLQNASPSHPVRQIRALVKERQIDLIHSHLPDQNFFSCVAGWLTRRPTVVTYHGALDQRTKGAGKLWFVRNTAAAVVAVSDYLKSSLQAAGCQERKLHRIYNGIDPGKFQKVSSGILRKELGLADNCKVIGMVANLRGSKGYEFLVCAARKVVDAEPFTHFVAVGELDRTINSALRLLVAELGLESHFHLLGFRQDVPELLVEFDVFVLSSTSEGFSLATIEAMAASLPVVVTRSGGPEEIVQSGVSGLLVPVADSESLAAGILTLLRDPAMAARLSARARQEVEQKFSLRKMVADYEVLYRGCLESKI